MTGDENLSFSDPALDGGLEQQHPIDERIDPGIAGDMDRAANRLAVEIGGVQLGRREEQARQRVDRDPEILLGPGIAAVVTSEARLDVCDRDFELGRAKRSAKRARRVALDDDHAHIGDCRSNAPRHQLQVSERVGHPAAAEVDRWKLGHPIIVGAEIRVLSGQNEPRADAACDERFGERSELDGFRTRTGD